MSYTQPDGTGRCVGKHRHEPEKPRSAVPGGNLCGGCLHRLSKTLQEIPTLVDELELALLNRESGHGAKVSGTPTRPLPYNDDASAARLTLVNVLGSWTRLIAEERGEHLPSDLSARGQASWQGYRLEVWTVAQEWVDEYATNLHEAVSEARRVLAGSRSRLLTLGHCQGHTACDVETQFHYPCPGEIKARVDLVDEMLPAAVACTGCGELHEARALPALGKAMTGGHSWLTTAQAAQILGLSQDRTRVKALAEGWRLRDHPKVRPSRWHADDVDASKTRAQEAAQNKTARPA